MSEFHASAAHSSKQCHERAESHESESDGRDPVNRVGGHTRSTPDPMSCTPGRGRQLAPWESPQLVSGTDPVQCDWFLAGSSDLGCNGRASLRMTGGVVPHFDRSAKGRHNKK